MVHSLSSPLFRQQPPKRRRRPDSRRCECGRDCGDPVGQESWSVSSSFCRTSIGLFIEIHFGISNKIITTAGHDSKLTFCKSLGATHAINYKTASFRTSVSEITEKKGVNCIVDFIGAPYWTDNIDCLATDGRMCLLAFMGGNVVEKFDLRNLLIKRLKIEGSTLRSRSPEYQARLRDRIVEEVLPGLVGGELKLVVDRVFGWEDVVEAHEYMESNQSMGECWF